MIDDLQDLGLIEALHSLCGFVVVHQNDPALAEVDDVPAFVLVILIIVITSVIGGVVSAIKGK